MVLLFLSGCCCILKIGNCSFKFVDNMPKLSLLSQPCWRALRSSNDKKMYFFFSFQPMPGWDIKPEIWSERPEVAINGGGRHWRCRRCLAGVYTVPWSISGNWTKTLHDHPSVGVGLSIHRILNHVQFFKLGSRKLNTTLSKYLTLCSFSILLVSVFLESSLFNVPLTRM